MVSDAGRQGGGARGAPRHTAGRNGGGHGHRLTGTDGVGARWVEADVLDSSIGAEVRGDDAEFLDVVGAAGATREPPVDIGVSGKEVSDEVDGGVDAFLPVEIHGQDLGHGVPLDVDVVVLSVFDVGGGGTGLDGVGCTAGDAVGSGVVARAIPLQGQMVVAGVPSPAVLVGVELDDEGRIEIGRIGIIPDAASVAGVLRLGANLLKDPGDAVCPAVVVAEIDREVHGEGLGHVDGAVRPGRALLCADGLGQPVAVAPERNGVPDHVELGEAAQGQKQQGEGQEAKHSGAK